MQRLACKQVGTEFSTHTHTHTQHRLKSTRQRGDQCCLTKSPRSNKVVKLGSSSIRRPLRPSPGGLEKKFRKSCDVFDISACSPNNLKNLTPASPRVPFRLIRGILKGVYKGSIVQSPARPNQSAMSDVPALTPPPCLPEPRMGSAEFLLLFLCGGCYRTAFESNKQDRAESESGTPNARKTTCEVSISGLSDKG